MSQSDPSSSSSSSSQHTLNSPTQQRPDRETRACIQLDTDSYSNILPSAATTPIMEQHAAGAAVVPASVAKMQAKVCCCFPEHPVHTAMQLHHTLVAACRLPSLLQSWIWPEVKASRSLVRGRRAQRHQQVLQTHTHDTRIVGSLLQAQHAPAAQMPARRRQGRCGRRAAWRPRGACHRPLQAGPSPHQLLMRQPRQHSHSAKSWKHKHRCGG